MRLCITWSAARHASKQVIKLPENKTIIIILLNIDIKINVPKIFSKKFILII